MQEVIRVLWEYASKYRLASCYDRDAQQSRQDRAKYVVQNREELQKVCPPDVFQRVQILCGCWEELRDRDMEAAFTCGSWLGTSLR